MKYSVAYLSLLASGINEVSAFSPLNHVSFETAGRSSLQMKKERTWEDHIGQAVTAAAFAASIWASPASMMGPLAEQNSFFSNSASTAVAKEMASGSGSRVNKDPESLLRLGLPIPNDKDVRKFQSTIEEVRNDISSKRKSAAIDGVKKTKTLLNSGTSKFVNACRDQSECKSILASIDEQLSPLDQALRASTDSLNGSDQEREALDTAYKIQDSITKKVTALEEQMVPAGYVTPVPDDYSDLPQLKGRATVEFTLKKADGSPFVIDATKYPTATLSMIIDGFTAPVTGGNFVDLVEKGFYNNMKIQRSDGFVIQTGDPDGDAVGYVGTPSKSVGKGSKGERLIPNEIFVKGDKGPFYETTIEDEGRGGQATVLPFSSYGAMGWARDEYDPNSGSSQFFWLLFDSDLTPAGKNVLDGRYPCFGYVVEGADFLRDTKEDDVIISAKVTAGADLLVQPKSAALTASSE